MDDKHLYDRKLVPDAKGRVTLGKLAEGVSSYRAHREEDGRIVLEPMAEVPFAEAWLFANPEASASVKRGLKEAAAGAVRKARSFRRHVKD